MDILSWDGTLSSSDFSLAALSFAERWKKFNPSFPPWSWVACKKQPWVAIREVEGYLSLENICLLRLSEEDCGEETCPGEEETSFRDEEEPIDSATLVSSCDPELHYYDFHVVHSASYSVPVLYFRAYSSDGQPLVQDEIEKDLPSCSAKILSESKWTFITQEEHPYLNRPWYKLHPCGTSEWMKLLLLGDTAKTKNGFPVEQYMVSWFSVVGQVVGLRIPFEMLNDGQPLVQDEIEKDLPSCSAKILSESKWTFITQEEHPYLDRPWYKLHPCGTSEWMKLLLLGDTAKTKNGLPVEQYVLSWFSVVGQVVGLRIPFEMLNGNN